MKIFSLLLSLKIVWSQLQLNVLQGQPFYYTLQKEFDSNGYELGVESPNLGFSIQGGLTQGPLNTNIDANSIVSTSLLQQYNAIAFLRQIGQLYYIEITQYSYQGVLDTPVTLFNITSVNQTCQDIEILQNLVIIVHCINTSNNQIQIYNLNDTMITKQSFNVSLTNSNSVTSVNIQYYYNMEQYDVYFVYITKFSSFIYYSTLSNNTYLAPQLVWTYNASFLQIFISNDQEVFALQFNYLLFQYQQYQTNYTSQNKSNWIAMTIQFDYKDDFLIYLVNNYTITELFFLDQFYLVDEQFLPIQIKSAQMLSTYDNIYVLTPSYALVYGFEDKEYLVFSQFLRINLINSNNLLSSLQNVLITFANSGVQLYQLLDYALISQNPQNSGYLTINYYNLNGTFVDNQTLYIYLLSSYQNQIMPTKYGLQTLTYSPENPNFVNVNIGQYYVGSNISYYLNSTNLSGTTQFSKNIDDNIYMYSIDCDTALVSALNQFNSYLILCGKGEDIKVILNQYLQFTLLNVQGQQTTTQFYPNKLAFIGLSDQGDIFLAFSFQTIYVYYVFIDIYFETLYQIDLADILGVTAFTVQEYVVIDTNIFLLLNQSYVILNIQQDNFYVIEIGNQTFNHISGITYYQNYIFASNNDSLNVYVWYDDGIELYQQYEYQNIGQSIKQVLVYPLIDGLFFLTVYSNQTTQLSFCDKSIVNSVNLGSTLQIPVDTTNFTLNYSSTAYSSVYFYIHVIQNNQNYINIYQINQQQIGALKQSKWFSTIPQNITASSDMVTKIDYMSVYSGDGYIVLPFSHYDNVFQFPYFQLNPSYYYTNNIILNNSYTQTQVQLSININQLYMYVENNYLNTTINGNLSNGSFTINPYNYFRGAIQSYNISCNQCSSIQYQPILSNQYLYCESSTQYSVSYLQNNTFQLYLGGTYGVNYSQINNNINMSTQQINLTSIAYYPEDYQILIDIFLEVNTNAITWILLNGSTYYICTILPNTNQTINITISLIQTTNDNSILYNNGYLQIIQENFYSCYYYQIVNSTQLLTTIVSQTSTQMYGGVLFEYINIETTPQNQVFGSICQSQTNTIFSFIVNVTQVGNNSFVLNYFSIQYLQEFDFIQQLFSIQQMYQLGDATQENGFYVITLVYTTQINSGIIQLAIKDYQVLNIQEKCTFQLLNQKSAGLVNLMDVYQNQIAILQQTEERDVNSIILSLYYVDINSCNYEQIIQPYTYQVYDNQKQEQSIIFLNQNSLLVNLNQQTYIYEINNFLNVEFNSTQNSSIEITAYNNLYNQSQLINIYYTEPQQVIINTEKHTLAWYWILLITLLCLIIIILVGWFFFYRNKGQEPDQYQEYKGENEIEIKSAKKNENLTYL